MQSKAAPSSEVQDTIVRIEKLKYDMNDDSVWQDDVPGGFRTKLQRVYAKLDDLLAFDKDPCSIGMIERKSWIEEEAGEVKRTLRRYRDATCREAFLIELHKALMAMSLGFSQDLEQFSVSTKRQIFESDSSQIWPLLLEFVKTDLAGGLEPRGDNFLALLGPMIRTCNQLREKMQPFAHIYVYLGLANSSSQQQVKNLSYFTICLNVSEQDARQFITQRELKAIRMP